MASIIVANNMLFAFILNFKDHNINLVLSLPFWYVFAVIIAKTTRYNGKNTLFGIKKLLNYTQRDNFLLPEIYILTLHAVDTPSPLGITCLK